MIESQSDVERGLLLGGALSGYEHHRVEDVARSDGPVHLARQPNDVEVHVATLGLEQARALLADRRLSKDAASITAVMRQHMIAAGQHDPGVSAIIGDSMINADPPNHARLRRLVAAALTPRRVEELRSSVTTITRGLLDTLDPDQPVDVVAGLALPLPLTVICELLGVPVGQDRTMLAAWSSAMMTEIPEQQQPASEAMVGYLASLIEDKRVHPDEALLSALVHGDVDGDRLTPQEVLTTAVLMIAAGHETTTAAIGNTVAALLQTEQWSSIAARPESVPDVVRESLRFDPPTRNVPHYLVREPVSLGDAILPPGALVMVNLGSANRDPEAFGADAHRFLPFRARPSRSHLTFGHGLHRCVGSPLATMEIELAMGMLLSRWPKARPAVPVEQMVRNPHVVINGFQRVDVVLAG